MENGLPLETTRSLVENENYGVNKEDEKDLKKNTVHLTNNDGVEFGENVGCLQVGKKGKSFSPRNTRIHSIPK